tara:strand:+ start:430 stop:636 length:207 start_codon:yes stop_codon:yes gene_type:complete
LELLDDTLEDLYDILEDLFGAGKNPRRIHREGSAFEYKKYLEGILFDMARLLPPRRGPVPSLMAPRAP